MTRVGHLFAGIDGFGLGLDAASGRYETVFTCELADFPHGILAKRLPDAQHYRDIVELDDPPHVDILTGGFPCQDISLAGRGHGISGSRSGLWTEYARVIGLAKPAVVLIENVPALLRRGFEVVVANLVELGYRVEWDCLPAAAFGAPHLRDRVWIVAHRGESPAVFGEATELFPAAWADLTVTDKGWSRWPRAGFVDGEDLYRLEPLATTGDVKRGGRVPTPVARDWKAGGFDGQLSTMAGAGLWPTPDAGVFGLGRDPERFKERRAEVKAKGINGNGMGTPLAVAVQDRELWPTPRGSTNDGDAGGGEVSTYRRTPSQQNGTHGRYLQVEVIEAALEAGDINEADIDEARSSVEAGMLNPPWVEWLMGFPLGWTDPTVDTKDLIVHPWHLGEPPGIPRVAEGVPLRRERLTALGNALVPPAAAWLGHRIRTLTEGPR